MKEQVDTVNPFLTFAISLHDRGKIGNTFIRELLESINNQLYKNFEVVISDSSNRSDYSKTIASFENSLNIKHLSSGYSHISDNINFAIKNSKGQYIKIMFSDDLVLSRFLTTYLLLIYKIFKKKWVLFSSYDFKRDENVYFGIVNGRKPKWNDKLLYGINTISSPSVMSFVNFENNLFDNNLNLLMDCEFYFRLKEKYGNPYYSHRFYIGNRIHSEQWQNTISQKSRKIEMEYVRDIHKK
jgi:glycosyltransferase involved in cell wall biosynthesis